GQVVDPAPRHRHKRFSHQVLHRLQGFRFGSPAEVLLQTALNHGVLPLSELIERSHLERELALAELPALLEGGELVQLEPGDQHPNLSLLFAPRQVVDAIRDNALAEVARHHALNPLRRGLPREELKSRLKLAPRVFNAFVRLMVGSGVLVEHGTLLALPSHRVNLSPAQQTAVDQLLSRFSQAPYATPSIKECVALVGEDVLRVIIERGDLLQVSADVIFRRVDYDHMLEIVTNHMRQHGALTVAEFRDHFGTSRKYALAFLEYLDAHGVTVRDGDFRRLQ
ncbi:MAG: hypothetical protein HPY76_07445, partial [Anaerolineae bacterium]|nr:hypothetical protein [Anaerolineae bacterium]